MIKLKTYPITNNLILTNEILGSFINNFWNDVFINIKDTSHLLLMVKVHFTESEMGYKTLGNLRKVNFTDKELFIEYLSLRLGVVNDSYMSVPIYNITFSYIIKEGLAPIEDRTLLQDLSNKLVSFHTFNNMNLPKSMKPSDYGNILGTTVFETFTRYFVTTNKKVFQIDVYLEGMMNKVTILGAIDLSWIDTKLAHLEDSFTFKREIKKSTIYFLDGEITLLRKQILNVKPIKNLNVDNEMINDFYTFNIETIKLANNKLAPYLICAYNGLDYISSYANETLDQNRLFNDFISQLLSKVTL